MGVPVRDKKIQTSDNRRRILKSFIALLFPVARRHAYAWRYASNSNVRRCKLPRLPKRKLLQKRWRAQPGAAKKSVFLSSARGDALHHWAH